MKVLLEGSFLDRKENLLIFGNPGAGKSHLLCAIALELVATPEEFQAGKTQEACAFLDSLQEPGREN